MDWSNFPADDLHTCFSWVGTGAFASRENVVKFLKLSAVTEMDPLEFAYGDMYFTTYMNQPPYQIQNDLRELPQENAFSAGDGRIRNKIYMVRFSFCIDNMMTGMRCLTMSFISIKHWRECSIIWRLAMMIFNERKLLPHCMKEMLGKLRLHGTIMLL